MPSVTSDDDVVPKTKKCIYLDYNGTTPIYPSVLKAMLPYFNEHFGNPSSSHHYGGEPKCAIKRARQSLLRLLLPSNLEDSAQAATIQQEISSIIFTGCGTESNNLAIRLALLSCVEKVDANGVLHVVTSNVEHPAISQCLNSYSSASSKHGLTPIVNVTYVPVNNEGIVSTADIIEAIRPNTALVTIMTANNESGSIQPVFQIAKMCRDRGVLFHTDAAQAVGKVDLRGLADGSHGADMVTIVGHKFGAPKGIAALYLRRNCLNEYGRIDPEKSGSVLLMGGGQENGRRGGTENVPYIVGMGCASELLLETRKYSSAEDDDKKEYFVEGWKQNSIWMEKMRNRLLNNLVRGLEPNITDLNTSCAKIIRPNGPTNPELRLPNTLSVGLRGVQSGELLANIGHVVACSAGSACHSSSSQSSYSSVLKAMNVPPEYAIGTLRLTVGPNTAEEDVDNAAEIIVEEVLRQLGRLSST